MLFFKGSYVLGCENKVPKEHISIGLLCNILLRISPPSISLGKHPVADSYVVFTDPREVHAEA